MLKQKYLGNGLRLTQSDTDGIFLYFTTLNGQASGGIRLDHDPKMCPGKKWALEVLEPTNRAINIIFDGPPSHEAGRFVEVETDDGKSINAGEWIEKENGLWTLRITELSQKI